MSKIIDARISDVDLRIDADVDHPIDAIDDVDHLDPNVAPQEGSCDKT